MVYVDFTAGNKDYKLRLNTRNTIALEKSLGCNPLAIFGDGSNLPTITTMVSILYYSLLLSLLVVTEGDKLPLFYLSPFSCSIL